MNKITKTSTFLAALALCQMSFANDPTLQADRDAVNSSCSAEAATAGCASDAKVGSGLLKCIHAYKKEHKEFKISEGCKSASQKLKADHEAHKAEKEAKKANKS